MKPKISIVLLTVAVAISLQACSKNEIQLPGKSGVDRQAMASGFSTLETACFSCHSPDPGAANPIAPTMASVKRHYMDRNSSYENFRSSLVAFVGDPSAQNSIMRDAVETYGFMPKMPFDRKTLDDIAYYLYYSKIETSEWYPTQYEALRVQYAAEELSLPSTVEDYRSYGQQLAMRTKTELGSNLKRAIQAGGASGAVEFCNVRAEAIAQEMSLQLGAKISRVSDLPRNPTNLADPREFAVLQQFRGFLAAGEKPVPTVSEFEDHIIGYYPIVTNVMCLQCHGSVDSDIEPKTLAAIRAAYPNDQAVGYGTDQLRGMFVVRMNKAGPSAETD